MTTILRKSNYKLSKYEPWMLEKVIDHVNEGSSYGSFAAKHNINQVKWAIWTKERQDLRRVRDTYIKMQNEKRKGWK